MVRRCSLGLLFSLVVLPSCSSSETAAEDEGALAAIPESSIKEQSIGNCWSYSTIGWLESLRKSAGAGTVNFSEAYLTYWWWFDQIRDANRKKTYSSIGVTLGRKDYDAVYEGGRYSFAFDLMRRYGVMDESAFLPGKDGTEHRMELLQGAMAAMNHALASGRLKTEDQRADAKRIRDELNQAFGLSPRVVKLLNDAFGEGEPERFDANPSKTPPAGSPIRRAADLPVTVMGKELSLDRVLGTPTGTDVENRQGADAWSLAQYPCAKEGSSTNASSLTKARRKFMRRVQKVLHGGTPVPLTWWVDQDAGNEKGAYITARHHGSAAHAGRHASLIDDYQVTTPHYGNLSAGHVESRAEALKDALSADAKIEFIRVKNSWGLTPGATTGGYNDLYMSYLDDVGYGSLTTPTLADYKCTDQPALVGVMLPNAVTDDEP